MPVYYAEYSHGRDTYVACPDCAANNPDAAPVTDIDVFINAWPNGYTCDDCAAIVPGIRPCDECDELIYDGNWYYSNQDDQIICASCYGERN